MKTFTNMNPVGSRLDKESLKRFIADSETLLLLLERCKEIDLVKTKSSISISKWIKLRLGDAFRVVIYHNERHLVQAGKGI